MQQQHRSAQKIEYELRFFVHSYLCCREWRKKCVLNRSEFSRFLAFSFSRILFDSFGSWSHLPRLKSLAFNCHWNRCWSGLKHIEYGTGHGWTSKWIESKQWAIEYRWIECNANGKPDNIREMDARVHIFSIPLFRDCVYVTLLLLFSPLFRSIDSAVECIERAEWNSSWI